ncbi:MULTISPECIES: hypothetical protein [unclassified Serratia (in: enterobacteria)]|uniref:hypothetical protein n=1 Tax=unclassified Serratia (in: enterobacteria) TaxID=2647522 RepID=UPI0012FEBA18|nr:MULTISPECIES: hypothetical protein [unclassified Serratia (in: enterobacteria)]
MIRGGQYQSTGKKGFVEVLGFLGLSVLIRLAEGVNQLRYVIGVDGDLLIEAELRVSDVGAIIEANNNPVLIGLVPNCNFRSVGDSYKTGHIISKKHAID